MTGEVIHSQTFTPAQRVRWAIAGSACLLVLYGLWHIYAGMKEGWGKDMLFMAMFLLGAIGLFAPIRAVFDVERFYRLSDNAITCEVRGLFLRNEIVLNLSSIKDLKVIRQDRGDSADTYCVRMITASGKLMDFTSQGTREEAEALLARVEAALTSA